MAFVVEPEIRHEKGTIMPRETEGDAIKKKINKKKKPRKTTCQRQLIQIYIEFYVNSLETGLTVWHDGAFKYLKNIHHTNDARSFRCISCFSCENETHADTYYVL